MCVNENSTITIYIKYLVTGETFEFDVEKSMKVYELKKKIENKLGIRIYNHLMLKNIGRRNANSLNDESLTLNESHVRNGATITIVKNDVKGGGEDEFANLSQEFIRKDEVLIQKKFLTGDVLTKE